jgi:hypothetical protein
VFSVSFESVIFVQRIDVEVGDVIFVINVIRDGELRPGDIDKGEVVLIDKAMAGRGIKSIAHNLAGVIDPS